jgi:hypothetical protein
MKDSELRGLVLQWFYDQREQRFPILREDAFDGTYPYNTLQRICAQLAEQRLIASWHPTMTGSGPVIGHGSITADGTDVVEGTRASPISISFEGATMVTVRESQNVQIGNNNVQNITIQLKGLLNQIDNSSATLVEREEAKSLLKKFLDHPLVAAVGGAAIAKALGF